MGRNRAVSRRSPEGTEVVSRDGKDVGDVNPADGRSQGDGAMETAKDLAKGAGYVAKGLGRLGLGLGRLGIDAGKKLGQATRDKFRN